MTRARSRPALRDPPRSAYCLSTADSRALDHDEFGERSARAVTARAREGGLVSPVKSRVQSHLVVVSIAAATFYGLADIAEVWGGGLSPNPLWLATASTTALAAVLPSHLRPSAVVGGAIGCIVAGPVLFNESLRSLTTPCLGNTAETVIAVTLLPKALSAELSLGRTRRAIAWIGTSILASLVGAIIATSDTSSTVIGDRVESLLRWTIGDVVGLLLLPPLFVAFRSPWITPRYRLWWTEAMAMSGVLVVTLVAAFQTDAPFPYALVPIVMWLGIRFGPRLAMPAALFTGLGSTYLTSQEIGPFVRFGSDAVVQVQALNVAVALSALVASAHGVRAWNDQQRLRATLEAVPDVIVTLSADGRAQGAWGPPELRSIVSDFIPTNPAPSDDPLAAALTVASAGPIHRHASGRILERRTTIVDPQTSLHLFRDVTDQHRAVALRVELENDVDEARLSERRTLARDLHDGPLQLVAAAKLLLETIDDSTGPEAELLRRSSEVLAEAISQLRSSLTQLSDVHAVGPTNSLSMFGADVLRSAGISLTVNDGIDDVALDPRTGNALILIGREAILNAATHSRADHVNIDLTEDDGFIELSIMDNGDGLPDEPEDNRLRLGLTNMAVRAEQVGGTVTVRSTDSSGTIIQARLPAVPPK